MRSHEMRFVLIPSRCNQPVCSMGGHPVQREVFEVRSIPGNLIGVGNTIEEALASVADLILWTIQEEGVAAPAWYKEAWAYADSGDELLFGRAVTDECRQLLPPKPIDLLSRAAPEQGSEPSDVAHTKKRCAEKAPTPSAEGILFNLLPNAALAIA